MEYILKVNDKTYNLKMSTKNIREAEELLGFNLTMLYGRDGTRVPTITELCNVIMCAFPEEYRESAFDIIDEWIDEGHDLNDLVNLVVEIFKVSGLFKEKKQKGKVVK